jgi:internalin A
MKIICSTCLCLLIAAAGSAGYARSGEPAGDASEAIAELEKSGAAVRREEGSAEKPTISVEFPANVASDDALAILPRIPQLRGLKIDSSKPSILLGVIGNDRPVVSRQGWKNVALLAGLRNLSLSGNFISDDDLALLAGLPELEELTLNCDKISDAGLAHLKNAPKLRCLTLAEMDGQRITDAGLEHLTQMKQLRKLAIGLFWRRPKDNVERFDLSVLTDVNNSPSITDETLKVVGRCSALEEIYLCSPNIHSAGLKSLNSLKNLRVLHVNCAPLEAGAIECLADLPDLRELSLAGSYSRNHHPVLSFDPQNRPDLGALRKLEKLEVLDLSFNNIDDDDMLRFRAPPRLKELYLRSTKITGPGLASLSGMDELRHLDLCRNAIQGKYLENAAKLKRLESLELHRRLDEERGFDDNDLAYLKEAVGLKHLGLSNTNVSDAGMEHLQNMTQLQSLRMLRTGVAGPGLKFLEKANQLQELALCSDFLTDDDLAFIRRFSQLKILNLVGLGKESPMKPGNITDKGIENLLALQQLEELIIIGKPHSMATVQVTGIGLNALGGLRQLKTLILSTGSITDADLVPLSRMRQLQNLSLRGCYKITNVGIAPIGALRNLKELDLVGTQLNEDGFEYLKDLTSLEKLVLPVHSHFLNGQSRERMTQKLRKMLPKTKVVWE